MRLVYLFKYTHIEREVVHFWQAFLVNNFVVQVFLSGPYIFCIPFADTPLPRGKDCVRPLDYADYAYAKQQPRIPSSIVLRGTEVYGDSLILIGSSRLRNYFQLNSSNKLNVRQNVHNLNEISPNRCNLAMHSCTD